jgi:hypothetical protein
MSEFEFLIHPSVIVIFTSSTIFHFHCQRHSPALAMSASHASSSGSPNPGNHYQPLKLGLSTISCTLAMAASRVRACISQYQTDAASNVPSSDRIKYFKAGVQWEMNVCHRCPDDCVGAC